MKVTESATALVRGTMAGLEERFPALRTYTERQRQHTAEDVAHIVDFLGAALYVDDELFTSFMAWTADILTARNVPAHSLHVVLDLLAEQLRDLPRAVRVIHQARPRIDSSGVSSHLPHERR